MYKKMYDIYEVQYLVRVKLLRELNSVDGRDLCVDFIRLM